MEDEKEPSQKKRKTQAFLDKDACAGVRRPLTPQEVKLDVDSVLDQLLYVRKRMGEESSCRQFLPGLHAATS